MKLKLTHYLVLGGIAVAGALFWLHQTNRELPPTKPAMIIPSPVSSAKKQPSVKPVQAIAVRQIKIAPLTADKLDELSSAVRSIVDEHAAYAERLAACQLSTITNLDEGDRDALYTFLLQKSPLDANQNGQILKNALLDSLTSLNPPPSQLGEVLVQIYRDHGQDEVLRDYAVQHLVSHYEQVDALADTGGQDRQNGQAQVQAVLWEATRETGGSIAGTALLGLSHLTDVNGQEFDRNRIGETSLRLAQSNDTGELTRITALQVCANLGMKEALPLAVQTVRESENVPLKISAIGALGILAVGDADAKSFLEQVQKGNEPRLQQPAQLALKRIALAEKQAAEAKQKI